MSPLVLDRMACLQRRADELRAAAQVLGETDAKSIGKAVDVVVRLAPVEACGDRDSLAADAPPIAEPGSDARRSRPREPGWPAPRRSMPRAGRRRR